MPKPVLHGRDHRPGGADPIEGLGGGGGIQYDTLNEGNWLWITATQSVYDGHVWGGINLWDESGYGIIINSYGGDIDPETGEATLSCIADDGVYIATDNTVTSGPHDGGIVIDAEGPQAFVYIHGDVEGIGLDSDGVIDIEADTDVTISGETVYIGSWGGQTYIDIGSGFDLVIANLPTSAPAATNAVWNDSGTLKIT